MDIVWHSGVLLALMRAISRTIADQPRNDAKRVCFSPTMSSSDPRQLMSERQKDYVILVACSQGRIIPADVRHLCCQTVCAIIVRPPLRFRPRSLMRLSWLSGWGAAATPEWGTMLAEAREFILPGGGGPPMVGLTFPLRGDPWDRACDQPSGDSACATRLKSEN